ncbi:glycoside hydrolase family 92 protein [Amycolatopsis sp. NBC_00345]|uniref:glycoside hydrolase domain-containing protein n=1 Tax=Amycolatopsis sp. NBC_00345 TaxID=2975955 RepID=UPI002E259A18
MELDRYRVRAELTAATRAGRLRFTFHDAGTGRLKVDLTRRIGGDGSHSIAQSVRQVDATTVEGWMRCDHAGGGWICGAQMSAWYLLAAAGFYPVSPASGVYVLGSPVFDRVRFTTGRGTTFTVRADGNSEENVYVRSARLNGRPLRRAWLTHEEVVRGGELRLTMGSTPDTSWGADPRLTSSDGMWRAGIGSSVRAAGRGRRWRSWCRKPGRSSSSERGWPVRRPPLPCGSGATGVTCC